MWHHIELNTKITSVRVWDILCVCVCVCVCRNGFVF